MAADLVTRFRRFVREKNLVRPGDRVLVAVSGGVDSMVLLHLFHTSAEALQIEIVAAHFDHAMRAGSAEDARFVEHFCTSRDIPVEIGRAGHPPQSEAQARDARYRFLADVQARTKCMRLATAHHADDQIETVLFRLMRGAGMRGLSGIPIRRGTIIRPLLRFRKRELERYAAVHRIAYREDESNVSEQFARNRIRRMLVPALHATRPESIAQLRQLARHAARTEGAWRARIRAVRGRAVRVPKNGVSELARGVLLEYDAETRSRLMRAELRRFGIVPDRAATDRLNEFVAHADSGARLMLGGGVRIERAFDVVRLARVEPASDDVPAHIAACADGAANAVIGRRTWQVRWTTSSSTNDAGARFDCGGLHFPLVLRGWLPGDRIRMPYGSKKLKKLLAEARVPFHERAAVPVLADADGRICWVVGVARSVDALAQQNDPALTIVVTHVENS